MSPVNIGVPLSSAPREPAKALQVADDRHRQACQNEYRLTNAANGSPGFSRLKPGLQPLPLNHAWTYPRIATQLANAALSFSSCSCDRLLAMISNFGPALNASMTRSVVTCPRS